MSGWDGAVARTDRTDLEDLAPLGVQGRPAALKNCVPYQGGMRPLTPLGRRVTGGAQKIKKTNYGATKVTELQKLRTRGASLTFQHPMRRYCPACACGLF